MARDGKAEKHYGAVFGEFIELNTPGKQRVL